MILHHVVVRRQQVPVFDDVAVAVAVNISLAIFYSSDPNLTTGEL